MDLRICGIIDIIIIVFALIFIFVGFKKGFMKKVLSFAGFLLVIALSFLYCGQLSSLLSSTGFLESNLKTPVVENLQAKADEMGLDANSDTAELISKCLNIPEFLAKPIANKIKIGETDGSFTYYYDTTKETTGTWTIPSNDYMTSSNATPVDALKLTNTNVLTLTVSPSSNVTVIANGFVSVTEASTSLVIELLDSDNNVLATLNGTSTTGCENGSFTFAGSPIGSAASDSQIVTIRVSSISSSVDVGITSMTVKADYIMTIERISNAIGDGVYNTVLTIIAWFIIFVAVWIVIIILKAISSALRNNKGIRIIDGILGSILYLAIFALIVCIAFFLLSFAIENNWIPAFTDWVKVDLQLDTDQFRISKLIYEGNIFKRILDLFVTK